MDLKGSLTDTNLKIFPSKNLLQYLKTLPIDDNVPFNIVKLVKGENYENKHKRQNDDTKKVPVHLDSKDIKNLNKIKEILNKQDDAEVQKDDQDVAEEKRLDTDSKGEGLDKDSEGEGLDKDSKDEKDHKDKSVDETNPEKDNGEKQHKFNLTTLDIDWIYTYLQKQRSRKDKGDENVPYLHVLLEGTHIETPENQVMKRNPVLEARCVKLRAQQEARNYRKMTKSVDNVRMRFPEDNISYQLKQVNRQLIAIGQFVISIFAGFLFGFRGVEWMVGNLDFGFRLLLGVMCALVIALAEIYFLAKKLNEELNIPETIQLGGPPKFADQPNQRHPDYVPKVSSNKAVDKEHQD